MADQPQADDVGGTQQAPMPSADQQASSEQVAPTAAPQEVSEGTGSDHSLSGDVSSRTAEQFEKLKSDLREERTKREQLEQAFTYQSQASKPVVEEPPLYDPVTGYVDVNKLEGLRKTVGQAEKRAISAEQKFERFIQNQQEQEAYSAHPELNPDAKSHDKELFKLTRAIILDSSLNPQEYGGKELSAKQAADMAKNQRNKVVEQAKLEGATAAMEQLTPKEQASLEATGRSDRRVDTRDQSELVDRSRRNDFDAIAVRLKNIG